MTVKLIDFRYELLGRLRKGPQVIRAENVGPTMHEMDIFRLHDGKTLADVNRWRKHPGDGSAPADAMGGVLDSHDLKRVIWMRKTLLPVGTIFVVRCRWSRIRNPPTWKSTMLISEWSGKSRSRNSVTHASSVMVDQASQLGGASKQGCLLDKTGKMPVLRAKTRCDQLFSAAGDDQFLRGRAERREGE